MTETIEIRIPEIHATKYLPAGMGVTVGGVARKLELSGGDPLLREIGEIDASFKQQNRAFFTGWAIHRRYTKKELRSSPLVHLRFEQVVESAGEEFGTTYEDSHACAVCGGGSQQSSELILDTSQLPKKSDIVRTLAGEIVVSSRMRRLWESNNLDGAGFGPVLLAENQNAESNDWYQLLPSSTLGLNWSTQVGDDPFGDAKTEPCVCGYTLGLNLLSEVSITDTDRTNSDLFVTREFIGVRRGLLRPAPLVLASQNLFDMLTTERMKGLGYEVVHMT